MPSGDLYTDFSVELGRLLASIGSTEQEHLTLLVACSGGVDSMVLLDLTERYCTESGAACVVAHVNHGVRESSVRDADLVQKMAHQLNVPCLVESIDWDTGSPRSGIASEADLRERRYEILLRQAKAVRAAVILTAHHADDQLETILWRLLRGTSLSGISGMPAITKRGSTVILRPLLSFSKGSLEEYATDRGICFAVDETNFELHQTRNLLRHQVVPQLKQLNPDILQSVTRFSDIVRAENSWLDDEGHQVLNQAARRDKDATVIRISQLLEAPLPLQRRAIKILLYCLASADWAFQHVSDILRLAAADSPSAYIQLPHGLVARRVYDVIRIEPVHAVSSKLEDGLVTTDSRAVSWELAHGAHKTFADTSELLWKFTCSEWQPPTGIIVASHWSAVIPATDRVTIRTAENGERVRPFGMKGTKKLQDVFVDAKVPRVFRQQWPVLCIGNEIIWVPGLIRSRFHLLADHDQTGWSLTCEPPSMQSQFDF